MTSRTVRLAAGLVAVVALSYSILVTQELLIGVLSATAIIVLARLLAEAIANGYPRSLDRAGTLLTVAIGTIIVGYATFVHGSLLVGIVYVTWFALLAWAVSHVRSNGYPRSLGRERTLVAGGGGDARVPLRPSPRTTGTARRPRGRVRRARRVVDESDGAVGRNASPLTGVAHRRRSGPSLTEVTHHHPN